MVFEKTDGASPDRPDGAPSFDPEGKPAIRTPRETAPKSPAATDRCLLRNRNFPTRASRYAAAPCGDRQTSAAAGTTKRSDQKP